MCNLRKNILSIDINGLKSEPQQMGNLVRTELEKLDTFEVMDRYDVAYMVEKNKLSTIKDSKNYPFKGLGCDVGI